jgi:uncharacterized protein involved in tellurium resistance
MKYIITESSLDKVIFKYLDEIFPTDNIRTYVTIDFDDETGEEYDDESQIIFYEGPENYNENNELFRWYGCDFFYENAPQRQNQTCPVVIVKHPYDDDLSDTFGEDSWQEAFKQWMMEKYNLPVTTVEWNRLRK